MDVAWCAPCATNPKHIQKLPLSFSASTRRTCQSSPQKSSDSVGNRLLTVPYSHCSPSIRAARLLLQQIGRRSCLPCHGGTLNLCKTHTAAPLAPSVWVHLRPKTSLRQCACCCYAPVGCARAASCTSECSVLQCLLLRRKTRLPLPHMRLSCFWPELWASTPHPLAQCNYQAWGRRALPAHEAPGQFHPCSCRAPVSLATGPGWGPISATRGSCFAIRPGARVPRGRHTRNTILGHPARAALSKFGATLDR